MKDNKYPWVKEVLRRFFTPFVLEHIEYMMKKEKPLREFYESINKKGVQNE